MLQAFILMMPIPPINANAASSAMAAWVIIGLSLALVLVATALWIAGDRHITQEASQVEAAEWHLPSQPLDEHLSVQATEAKVHARV